VCLGSGTVCLCYSRIPLSPFRIRPSDLGRSHAANQGLTCEAGYSLLSSTLSLYDCLSFCRVVAYSSLPGGLLQSVQDLQ
jgi:hypothetical protein